MSGTSILGSPTLGRPSCSVAEGQSPTFHPLPPQKLYRGTSDRTGNNSANLGKGLYVTTDRAEAKKYGNVQEMHRNDLPQNPLRFSDELKYREWESFVARELLGHRRITEFEKAHGLPDAWIRQLIDPKIDGVQIGTGRGAWFVKYPPLGDTARGSAPASHDRRRT